jgi:hypothetical protein
MKGATRACPQHGPSKRHCEECCEARVAELEWLLYDAQTHISVRLDALERERDARHIRTKENTT